VARELFRREPADVVRMDEREQTEEAMLVLLAQQGDGQAFRTLVEAYDRRLLYFVRRIFDEAEEAFDILQEVWLRVHRNLRKLKSPRAFRVWLYRIAHDQAISALRRHHRLVPLEHVPAEEMVDEEGSEVVMDSAEIVHAALKTLSMDHRRVLVLRFLEDMSIEEIAEVLDCSLGTVKSRLHYAKAALGRWLEESRHG
jgi:RNA polymerase sigma-70 factor (ECF subfamily)